MLRKCAAFLMFFALGATGVWAQGLNVPPGVTKDDWEEINFEFNSSVLVDGFPSLLRLAELLQMNPGYRVRVDGHTDVIGGNQYNDRLGLARANAVRDFLVKYGAQPNQITTGSAGKADPKYPGQRPTYSRTDEARYMNRRVSLTVTDAQGNTVSAGGPGEAIRAIEQPKQGLTDCCSEVLKRLDRLDDIAKMLKDLADSNADLRKQVADLQAAQQGLQKGEAAIQNQVAAAPRAPTTDEVAAAVQKSIDANKMPRYQLLGVNVGSDDVGHVTFSGKARYFAPFNERFAFEAQGEFLYFKTDREGQIDLGLVDREGPVQAALFASFKHATLVGDQTGGTLGQAALTVDYVFKRGKVGVFGTKGFLDNALVNTTPATDPVTGALLSSVLLESYLRIVDQVGVSTSLGLWGNNYLEGNFGWLRTPKPNSANRVGATARFVFPLNSKLAFTVEGDINPTLLGPGNDGRAVVGLQLGNMLRPKEFLAANHPVPVDPPRIRYEVVTERVRVGETPPVADAGPPQVNVPAGTITLNGSGSYSPQGSPLTYVWTQEAGPPVTLSAPTSAITTFTAVAGTYYAFRLTVRDPYGGQGIAQTYVSTSAATTVQIVFFNANPSAIAPGQSSTLSWQVVNATSVTLSGVGTVQAVGSMAVSPTVTTTYTLTASNATGSTSANAVVVVNTPAVQLVSCYAAPTNISPGQAATLNWTSTNATSVSITPSVGTVALSGNIAVTPTSTTTYTITATGANSTSATCSVAVTVTTAGGLPQIIQFSATPQSINSGQSATLQWIVQNATTVSISGGIGNVALTGSQTVSPTSTTTYTITATNSQGSVTATASVTVNVIPAPSITGFTASPNPSPASGTLVTLTCSAANAVSLNIAGALFNGGSGTYPVFPTTTTTYTCTATGQNGQTASQSVTVTVNGPAGPPYQ